ncbi:protein usf [Aplysia californica]|uniref:Protein usf n=1 Tax=Aplysia californica TaxID=6500 RepID=A0ABM0JIR6_APLCA|nr:protein usf [Aplysia californica]
MRRSSYNLAKASGKESGRGQSSEQKTGTSDESFRSLSTMAAPQKIQVDSANKAGKCPAILCDAENSKAGIIVLQEWWGLNQQIQDCGKEVSCGSKMVTLVPDLYRGKVAVDNETAGHYMGDLDWKGAIDDIQGCAQYLKGKGCVKVGVTGFCMGGALSMAAAALVPEIDAAVPFYGIPSAELCDVTTIKVPLQCHFGDKDSVAGFSSPAEWKPLKAKLEAALKSLEFYNYDCDHAFTNKTGANYNPDAAKLAFSRMFQFFQKNLS